MMTFEEAMAAKENGMVAALRAANLGSQDMVNLFLQRSEIIRDQNNHTSFIKAWTRGDDAPLLGLYKAALSPKGRIMLDLRARQFAGKIADISKFGFVRYLSKAAHGGADRIMIAKTL